jgi:anti-anti-sigma factor
MVSESVAFSVEVDEFDASCPIIGTRGEVDIATALELAASMAKAIAKTPRNLVLDLSETSFFDCAGVGVIVSARQSLPEPSRVIVRQPRPFTRMVLTTLDVDTLCALED